MANYDFGFDQSYDIPSLRKKRFDDFGSFQMPDMGNLNPPDQSDPFDTGDQYQNLFKQNYQNPISAPSVAAPNGGENLMDEYIKMREKFPGEHTATDRFNQLLNQYPEHEKPSLGRTLVASAAGLGGGAKAAYEVLDRPYVRDVAAWKDKAGPEYNAANLERQSNLGELQSMNQMVGADVNNRRYINQQKGVDERNRITENKNIAQAETARMRQEILARKAEGWQIKEEGSRVYAYMPPDKANPQGRTIDMGSSHGLDRETLENLKGGWNVKAARERGMYATSAATIRGSSQMKDEQGNIYIVAPDGGLIPVGGSPDEPEGQLTPIAGANGSRGGGSGQTNPNFSRGNITNAFQVALLQNPKWSRFVIPPTKAGETYQFKPPVPPHWWSSIDPKEQADYDEFRRIMGFDGGNQQPTDSQPEVVGPPEPPKPTKPSLFGTTSGGNTQSKTQKGDYKPTWTPMPDLNPGVKTVTGGTRSGQLAPMDIKTKAAQFLQSHGQTVTAANIEHAIQMGWVQ